jgi:hypothetical protein
MPSYKPFLIGDFRTGKLLGLKPWKFPMDAFTTMFNAYISDGVIHKRNGYTQWDRIIHDSSNPGNPVMGIYAFLAPFGPQLLAFDTKRLNYYDPATNALKDPVGSDSFTGTDADFFNVCNALAKVYINNNYDRMKEWDGTNLSNVTVDIDGDGANQLNHCLGAEYHKRRLLLFRPTEDGATHNSRVRWPSVGTTDYSNDGYVDAATNERIMGWTLLGDDVLVWFQASVWLLRYTGNSNLPFRWERIHGGEGMGTYSPQSVVSLTKRLAMAMGTIAPMGCDGYEAFRLDQKIPDIMTDEMNLSNLRYCYGTTFHKLSQVLMTYPRAGQTYPDRVLAINYEDKAWSTYGLDVHCFGKFSGEEYLTWDDASLEWDQSGTYWDQRTWVGGYPILLAGDRDGYIWQLHTGNDDNGNDINFELLSGRWNPFIKEGKKAKLGYVDFLVTRNANTTLTVDFYVDQESSAYQSQTLKFTDGSTTKDKIFWRVYSGAMAAFHRIKLSHTQSYPVEIHAIVPYFRPAGRLV